VAVGLVRAPELSDQWLNLLVCDSKGLAAVYEKTMSIYLDFKCAPDWNVYELTNAVISKIVYYLK